MILFNPMGKKFFTALLILFVLVIGTQMVSAEDDPGLVIYNTRLVTSDKEATFIEGEVSSSCGQTIAVKAGLRTISKKVMPDTGMPSKFKIKVPSKCISDENVAVMYVQERKGDSVLSKAERVEIEYIARQKQEVTTDSAEYDLTFPGLDESIEAKATSGEKLIYTSSDPDIVEVDEEGNLTAKGEGTAEISVRQIGSSAYQEAEKTVNVSVEEIDAYTITYHFRDDKDTTEKQIVRRDEPETLEPNTTERGDHQFLGWTTEEGGLREFTDEETIEPLAEKGENVDLYGVWTGDGIPAAIAWAVDIAADDSFTYGKKPETSTVGCYFCGTNQKRKPKGYEKTYVCMTFITAAYAHGAEDPEMLALCRGGKRCLSTTDSNFKYSCWKKVGLCKNLSESDLEPGDVICWYAADNKSGHLSMYIGNGQIVEATSGYGDLWGPVSIGVRDNKANKAIRFAARRNSKSYVMRYVGNGADS